MWCAWAAMPCPLQLYVRGRQSSSIGCSDPSPPASPHLALPWRLRLPFQACPQDEEHATRQVAKAGGGKGGRRKGGKGSQDDDEEDEDEEDDYGN